MSEEKHTPGPWIIGKTGECIINPGLKNDDPYDEQCDESYGGKLIAESIKPENLPVIAAAPELLELVQAVEWVVDENFPDGEVCPWCGNYQFIGHAPDCPRQRALKKALGESDD